jgi:hypothetical protein
MGRGVGGGRVDMGFGTYFVVAHPYVFAIIVYNLFSQQHTLINFIYYFVLR